MRKAASKQKGAGVIIPVFSLRTLNSLGIGEFLDLKVLADWADLCDMRMIQILPVLDSIASFTFRDSYPYAPISAFALHPIYINLPAIGELPEEIVKTIEEQKCKLATPSVHYLEVYGVKIKLLEKIFEELGEETLEGREFEDFFQANREWLVPYATFCALRDHNKSAHFHYWPEYRDVTEAEIGKIASSLSPHYNRVCFHYFLQYHAHKQLKEASEYALKKDVFLKGDFPVGVSYGSCDVWSKRYRFNVHKTIGAPPDQYSAIGQNWGFPSYNWEVMEKEKLAWFCDRLNQMEEYFQVVRIDHVVGFFRFWEVPKEQRRGIFGNFNPVHPVLRREIEDLGITNVEQLTIPYIRLPFLQELCGEDAPHILEHYLEEGEDNLLHFKEHCNTERKVHELLHPLDELNDDQNAIRKRIKKHLFALLENVILLRDETDENAFHFRFQMEKTPYYEELSPKLQKKLLKLCKEYFGKRQNELWHHEGLSRLDRMQKTTQMLICAEDLGTVPACAESVLKELDLLGLFIQRWSKDKKNEFGVTKKYPARSVCSPANHDTSTVREWWEEDRDITRRFYHDVLKKKGEPPVDCTPEIVEQIIDDHMHSPSMWALIQVQDLLGMSHSLRHPDPHAERINEPDNPEHFWDYRLHLPIEELIENKELTTKIKTMVKKSKRS